jgi:antitoxin (DNA-binding transcriptional repressor) of toxin-antitoxin stability system
MVCIHAILFSNKEFTMDEIAISKFKATCLAVIDRVNKTGKPVVVTRFGHPLAEIRPVGLHVTSRRFGHRSHTGAILGDIVGPVGDESDWEAAQEPDENPK